MQTVTVKQIQRLDDTAINTYGISSLVLMENAGAAVTKEIIKLLNVKSRPRVCIVCGLGNNAGDGFVAARHLLERRIKVKIYLIGAAEKLKNDAAVNYHILKKLKVPVLSLTKINTRFVKDINAADILVDAVFGVGLNREVQDPFYSVIKAMNKSNAKVIAVDIPSGLDGTSGKVHGVCIKAAKTVTFSFAKRGFLKGQGPAYVGKIAVADIGIPMKLLKKVKSI